MTIIQETIKNIIRIEKETYDLCRLLDQSKLDDKGRSMLRRCAMEASKNLRMLEEKYWSKEPSLATFLQHFVPEIEFEIDRCNECLMLENLIKSRKSLAMLYLEVAETNEDPDICDMFKEMGKRAEPFSST
jgi:hypothetical protein